MVATHNTQGIGIGTGTGGECVYTAYEKAKVKLIHKQRRVAGQNSSYNINDTIASKYYRIYL